MKKILLLIVIGLISFSDLAAKEYIKEEAFLIQIIDGDTIEINYKGQPTRVRLLGIQAPELYSDPPWEYANRSKNFLSSLLSNNNITIEYKTDNKKDKYNRILAYVYNSEGIMVNSKMIENGYAFIYLVGKEITTYKIDELKALQKDAINKKINIWSSNFYSPINPKQGVDYVGHYKIINASVKNVYISKNSTWINLENNGSKGMSLRISKNNLDSVQNKLGEIHNLVGKDITVMGFIDRYSNKYGPFVDIRHEEMIDIVK